MSKKRRLVTQIVTIMMVLIMTLSMAIPAFAYSEGQVVSLYGELSEDDQKKVEATDDSLSIDGTDITVYKSNDDAKAAGETSATAVTIGGHTYFLTQAGIDSAYKALDSIKTATENKANDQSVKGVQTDVEAISSAGPRADLRGAQDTLSGFQEILGVLLGILAYLIMMMLTVFTTIDIAYITIPPFRTLCDDTGAKSGGTGAMGSTNKSTGEAKFRWVTDEAMYAVQTATVESGKSAVVTYLGKRIVAIILVGVAVYLLLTGNIGLIMNLSLKMVSGIIDQIAALGKM